MRGITRSYRLRAYPNGGQRRLLDRWLGATRWLWNTALAIRSESYRACGLSLTGYDLSRWVTQWKRTAGHEWLVSFCAQVPRVLLPIVQRSVGVDVGISHLATLSTGEKIPNPKHYQARLKYLRQQQRCLARRAKGSQRRERQRVRLARAQLEVRHARQHALHALTTRLVRDFDVIALEDLNVKALARGRQARAIQDAAFGELRRQLTYKSDWYGRVLVEVDGWYPSSKRCSHCQHTLDELRLGERQWRCPACGSRHDRDINAARNLLIHGLRQLAGCDSRDLRVDARGACPEESVLKQVLANEARSGHRNRACLGRARLA